MIDNGGIEIGFEEVGGGIVNYFLIIYLGLLFSLILFINYIEKFSRFFYFLC